MSGTPESPETRETTAPDGGSPAEAGLGDRAGGAEPEPHTEPARPVIPPDPGWPLTPDYAGVVTARGPAAIFEEKRLG